MPEYSSISIAISYSTDKNDTDTVLCILYIGQFSLCNATICVDMFIVKIEDENSTD